MSALISPPSVSQSQPLGEPPLLQSSNSLSSVTPAVSFTQSLRAALQRLGLERGDAVIFGSLYALILLMVLALCVGARVGHAGAWNWGSHLINQPMVVAGVGLLLFAAFAALAGSRFAAMAQRKTAIAAFGLALACLIGFSATLLAEREAKAHYGIAPNEQFRPNDRYVSRHFGVKLPRKGASTAASAVAPEVVPAEHVPNAVSGRLQFLKTCMSCHGPGGEGMPGQGKSLVRNEFIKGRDDSQMLEFIKVGRQPWDPLNTTRVQMPPRGGNPMLKDHDLKDIISFLRTLQDPTGTPGTTSQNAPGAGTTTSVLSETTTASLFIDSNLLVPRSVLPPPPEGESGLSGALLQSAATPRWKAPHDGLVFANTFWFAASFGLLHAVGLIVALAVTIVRMARAGNVLPPAAGLLSSIGVAGLAAIWLLVFPLVFQY